MRETSTNGLRHDRIAWYRSEAGRLMLAVQDDLMKEQVLIALRDLDEAAVSANRLELSESPVLQQISDCALVNAIRRLAVVDAAVRTHGPAVALAAPTVDRRFDFNPSRL